MCKNSLTREPSHCYVTFFTKPESRILGERLRSCSPPQYYGFLKFQDAPRLDVYVTNLTTIKAVQATFPVLCLSGAVLILLSFRT